MQYRKFGKLDWEVSVLGFGAMRLPVIGEESAEKRADIDESEAIKMMRYAIDNGVNYVDTGYMYHGGKSEVLVGKALKDGYREKVKLATKLPPALAKTFEDCDKVLNKQLDRMQVDHIDFYLLHGINGESWQKLRDMNVCTWAEQAIADGRIGHLGFSFHGDLDAFKEIVDAYDKWALCQIQYNFMDTGYQAGTEGLQYAAEKGLAIVIMEPIRGGQLSKEPPPSVEKLYETSSVKRTPADLALQWIWNQPEVTVVLSGMTTMTQVVENVASAKASGVGSLTDEELGLIDQIRDEYIKICPIPCTTCGYCMPCPSGVVIPNIFVNYNDAMMYDDSRMARYRYRFQIPKERWGDQCEECHECEEKCPQEIEISEWLKKAHSYLGPLKKT